MCDCKPLSEEVVKREVKDISAWFSADLYNRHYILIRDDEECVDIKIIHQKDWIINKTRQLLYDYICAKGRLCEVEYVHSKTNKKNEHYKFTMLGHDDKKIVYKLFRCYTAVMEV